MPHEHHQAKSPIPFPVKLGGKTSTAQVAISNGVVEVVYEGSVGDRVVVRDGRAVWVQGVVDAAVFFCVRVSNPIRDRFPISRRRLVDVESSSHSSVVDVFRYSELTIIAFLTV